MSRLVALLVLLCALPAAAERYSLVLIRRTTSTTTTSTTTTVTTTTSAGTTSTSTSTTTTTSTSVTTTTLAGDGAFALYNAAAAASFTTGVPFYFANNVAGTTQTDVREWWTTSRTYTAVSGVVQMSSGPGAGINMVADLVYSETALASGEDCVDHVGSTVTTNLCTVSGTNRSCTFSVDLTTVNSGIGIKGPGCFQIRITPSAAEGAQSQIAASIEAKESSSDSISAFTWADTTSNNVTTYMGPTIASTTQSSLGTFFQAPKAFNACTGMLAVHTAPGSGKSWAYDVLVSTTGLGSSPFSTTCASLSYTTVTGCTISDTDKSCHFTLASATVPAGGCIQLRRTPTGGPASTVGQEWAVECTSDSAEPAKNSGAMMVSGQAASGLVPTEYNGMILSGSSVNENLFFRNGATAYSTCSGRLVEGSTGSGGQTYTLAVRYSATAPTSAQSCGSNGHQPTLTTTSNLCSWTVGTDFGCSFSNVSIPIAAYGCVDFIITRSGAATTAPVGTNVTLTCVP